MIGNLLNTSQESPLIQEKMTFDTLWEAPKDGIVTICIRSSSSSAFQFILDTTTNVYVGMMSIDNNQDYASLVFPVLKGHTYKFISGSITIQSNLYTHK